MRAGDKMKGRTAVDKTRQRLDTCLGRLADNGATRAKDARALRTSAACANKVCVLTRKRAFDTLSICAFPVQRD